MRDLVPKSWPRRTVPDDDNATDGDAKRERQAYLSLSLLVLAVLFLLAANHTSLLFHNEYLHIESSKVRSFLLNASNGTSDAWQALATLQSADARAVAMPYTGGILALAFVLVFWNVLPIHSKQRFTLLIVAAACCIAALRDQLLMSHIWRVPGMPDSAGTMSHVLTAMAICQVTVLVNLWLVTGEAIRRHRLSDAAVAQPSLASTRTRSSSSAPTPRSRSQCGSFNSALKACESSRVGKALCAVNPSRNTAVALVVWAVYWSFHVIQAFAGLHPTDASIAAFYEVAMNVNTAILVLMPLARLPDVVAACSVSRAWSTRSGAVQLFLQLNQACFTLAVVVLRFNILRGCGGYDHGLPHEIGAALPPGATFPDGLDPRNASDVARVVRVYDAASQLAGVALIPLTSMAVEILVEGIEVVMERRAKEVAAHTETLHSAIAYISHEARGPLNAANLAVELLEAETMKLQQSPSDAASPPTSTTAAAAAAATAAGEGRDDTLASASPGSPAYLQKSSRQDGQDELGVHELRAGLEESIRACARHLDDLALWERAGQSLVGTTPESEPASTPASSLAPAPAPAPAGGSGQSQWASLATSLGDPLILAFRGTCTAQGLHLEVGSDEVREGDTRRSAPPSKRRLIGTGSLPARASDGDSSVASSSGTPAAAAAATGLAAVAAERDVVPGGGSGAGDAGSVAGGASVRGNRRQSSSTSHGGTGLHLVAGGDSSLWEVFTDHDRLLGLLSNGVSNSIKNSAPELVRAARRERRKRLRRQQQQGLPRGSVAGDDGEEVQGGGWSGAGCFGSSGATTSASKPYEAGEATAVEALSNTDDEEDDDDEEDESGAALGTRITVQWAVDISHASIASHQAPPLVPPSHDDSRASDAEESGAVADARGGRGGAGQGSGGSRRRPPHMLRVQSSRGRSERRSRRSLTGRSGSGGGDDERDNSEGHSSDGSSGSDVSCGVSPTPAQDTDSSSNKQTSTGGGGTATEAAAAAAARDEGRSNGKQSDSPRARGGSSGSGAGDSSGSGHSSVVSMTGHKDRRSNRRGRRRTVSPSGSRDRIRRKDSPNASRMRRRRSRAQSGSLFGPRRAVLRLVVRDEGRGIAQSLLSSGKLFQPFARLRQGDNSLKMASSGLGLAIVRSIVVDALHGRVGLASDEGSGTALFASVPVWVRKRRAEPQAKAGEQHTGQPRASQAVNKAGASTSSSSSSSSSGGVGSGHSATATPAGLAAGRAVSQRQVRRKSVSGSGAPSILRSSSSSSASSAVGGVAVSVVGAAGGGAGNRERRRSRLLPSDSGLGMASPATNISRRSMTSSIAANGDDDDDDDDGDCSPLPDQKHSSTDRRMRSGDRRSGSAGRASPVPAPTLPFLSAAAYQDMVQAATAGAGKGSARHHEEGERTKSRRRRRDGGAPNKSSRLAHSHSPEARRSHEHRQQQQQQQQQQEQQEHKAQDGGDGEAGTVVRSDSREQRRQERKRMREARRRSSANTDQPAAAAAAVSGSDHHSRSRSRRDSRRRSSLRHRSTDASTASSTGSSTGSHPTHASLPPSMIGRTIFVVEDEKMNRTLLAAVLQRWGATVRTFENGAVFLEALKELKGAPEALWPVAVTLDVEMPVMCGRKALKARAALAQEWGEAGGAALAALPVVVVSGNVRSDQQQQMLRLGARCVVAKPVETPALSAALWSVSSDALAGTRRRTGSTGSRSGRRRSASRVQ